MVKRIKKTSIYPLLPVRDIVIFPYMLVPLAVGRRRSLNAIQKVVENDGKIVIATQKNIYDENPVDEDIYKVGVLGTIIQTLNLPDGSARILIEGEKRVVINKFMPNDEYYQVEVEYPSVVMPECSDNHLRAIMRKITDLFEDYAKLNPRIDLGSYAILDEIEDADKLADVIVSHIRLKKQQAQRVLAQFNPLKRIEKLSAIIKKEIEILSIQREIDGRVKDQMDRSTKEYYLSEQMKAIKKELDGKDMHGDEIREYEEKINSLHMPEEAKEQAIKELDRLKKMMPFSPEGTVIRTYLDWLIKLPWNKKSANNLDLKKAGIILESEHYGLDEAKERILEYLAVSKLSKKLKTPIICFIGPPGTGKTSFGRSIAHALGREFTRVSLGGIRDEAEIRGHRRTYIGAMPGRIIQSITKTGSKNPVFLLDEVDKMGKDFRGDPSSALLEALDPEQNKNFSDHYLEVEFDLSDVMFITTANTSSTIPPAMLDRMEQIKFPGYMPDEKIKIAQKFLVPKQINENGLKGRDVSFTDGAINQIIENFTREAGVRNLEREIAKIMRKIAGKVVRKEIVSAKITGNKVEHYLGVPKYSKLRAHQNDIGVAAGLSWTPNGGESLSIEVSLMPGDGKLQLTGTLGDVMKESAQAAMSYIRANARSFGIKEEFHKNKDVHIHVPAGAVPKEGPSAGITICTALLSVLLGKPIKKDVVMTGEITLSGKVLEIGGLKEKMLAAHRDGFKTIIFPAENKKNLAEIPGKIKKNMNLVPVEDFKEVIEHVF
ncbi:MAG: endopeptidase La [Elusimicrobiota bacterium]